MHDCALARLNCDHATAIRAEAAKSNGPAPIYKFKDNPIGRTAESNPSAFRAA